MEPRRKAQFLQEAARTHRYGPILWLVGPSNFRTRSSPPLSFNCRHICTGRPPQQSLGPLTAGLRATSLRRCRRRQGCPMKSAASRGAPGEGEERGGGERRGPMQLMRASVWLVARRVLPKQRCGAQTSERKFVLGILRQKSLIIEKNYCIPIQVKFF